MSQSRKHSFFESCSTVGSGFLLAWATYKFAVIPMISVGWLTIDDAFLITCIFTVVSLIRVYVWRRIFNWWQHGRNNPETERT